MVRPKKDSINIRFAIASIIIAIVIWAHVKHERVMDEKRASQGVYLEGQGDNTHGKNNHTQ